MGRPRRHPSGPGESVTVRLCPDALKALDAWRTTRGLTRAAAIERAILQGMRRGAPPLPEATTVPPIRVKGATTESTGVTTQSESRTPHPQPLIEVLAPDPDVERLRRVQRVVAEATNECAHHRAAVIAGGLKRCPECGMVRDMRGVWRLP